MFIFRILILYFKACTFDIDEFRKIIFQSRNIIQPSIPFSREGYKLHIKQFALSIMFQPAIYKWFENPKYPFLFYFIFRFFVPSESILLYCCYYYYYCYYYLPYDDQSCEHFQHVVTSFAQNMKIGMGC